MKDRRYAALLAAVVILGLAFAAFTVVRGQNISDTAVIQPQPVNIDQIARMAKDGNVKAIALNGDIVVAKLGDGSLVSARKEYQVSILETLRNYGVPESQLTDISLEVKDPMAASGQSAP